MCVCVCVCGVGETVTRDTWPGKAGMTEVLWRVSMSYFLLGTAASFSTCVQTGEYMDVQPVNTHTHTHTHTHTLDTKRAQVEPGIYASSMLSRSHTLTYHTHRYHTYTHTPKGDE